MKNETYQQIKIYLMILFIGFFGYCFARSYLFMQKAERVLNMYEARVNLVK